MPVESNVQKVILTHPLFLEKELAIEVAHIVGRLLLDDEAGLLGGRRDLRVRVLGPYVVIHGVKRYALVAQNLIRRALSADLPRQYLLRIVGGELTPRLICCLGLDVADVFLQLY